MKKKVGDLLVTENVQLNHDNYLITLQTEEALDPIRPGQFVNIRVKDASTTFLRRPFSVHDVDYSNNSFSILVKTVGEGSFHLSRTKAGERLDVLFPLGNGFSSAQKGETILLIGGGVGIAPMMQMARESKEIGAKVIILLGARSAEDHILLDEFSKHGELLLTSNDGSLGIPGFVTDHPILNQSKHIDRIYCCGPDLMMQAVAKKAKQLTIDCEVSLENMMACGYGVCLCCVTKTKTGNQCVCTEGPVFNINDLEWQI